MPRILLPTILLFGLHSAALGEEQSLVLAQSPPGVRENYKTARGKLESWRKSHATAYRQANNSGKAKIREIARKKLLEVLQTDIFPAWYGTTWDFNGISQTPGEGKIACGYFVSTCLRDAGFNVPRIRMAQQPSQRIIEALTIKSERKITAGASMEAVAKHLKASGTGLYVVGLDRHVGFVLVTDKAMTFVHSSYYTPPRCVVSEPIKGRNPLADSNYRVIGKILGDELLGKWLRGEAIAVQTK